MTKEEIFSEATSVYDNYVEVLETGSVEALQAYARNLSERELSQCVVRRERSHAAGLSGIPEVVPAVGYDIPDDAQTAVRSAPKLATVPMRPRPR